MRTRNDNLVTVITVTYMSELAVIEGVLAAEGIKYYIPDKFTLQSDPLLSNSIGGARLQVHAEDAERAMEILREGGYLKDGGAHNFADTFLGRLDSKLAALPLLDKLVFELRLAILLTIIISAFVGLLYLIMI